MMGFAALYPSCEDYCDRGLWLFGEPGLGKVLIEGIRRADPKPPHHYKRDAIGERVVFVLMLNKIKLDIVEQALINMDHLNGGAAEEDVPHFDGFGVVTAAVEERNDLIEHVGGRHEAWQGLAHLLPVPHSRWVVLIVGKFQCEQIAGIEENRSHGWVR
jgi:hypothetical protein